MKNIDHFFPGYFPSPSVCHKNSRFYWKLLCAIIHSLELEKLIITFFKKKMRICYNRYVSKNISMYPDTSYRHIEHDISMFLPGSVLRSFDRIVLTVLILWSARIIIPNKYFTPSFLIFISPNVLNVENMYYPLGFKIRIWPYASSEINH